jgi:HEAT repeat protein
VVVPYLLPLLASRDPEVRFYATFLFSEIQYPEAIPKLAALLFDPDLQTRILAIDVLKGFRRFPEFDSVTKELRETAWIASNPAPRRRSAVEAIGELRDAGAVAMLIEMVDVPDDELSDLCWKALVLITRQDHGKVKKKWQTWLAKEGARHHIEWLIDALVHPSPELRLGASEELKRITKEYFGYYYNLPKRDREKARKRYLEWWERIGRARFTGGRPG